MTAIRNALCFALLCAAGAVHSAERVERSTVRILGNDAGFQEARYADDGTVKVHYEYNDRGRGPKTDSTYRVGKDGRWDTAEIAGVAYFKTPVAERFAGLYALDATTLEPLFRKLDALSRNRAEGIPAWLLSHPKAAERIAAIEANEARWTAAQQVP